MARNDAAKYAFFYVLSLVALVFMSVSVGIIFFQIINKEIVDLINEYSGNYSDGAMKFAISAIIISAPIYYFTSKQIYKNLRQGKLKVIYVTKNAPDFLKAELDHFCKLGNVKYIELAKENDELGIICRKPFSISVLGVQA